MANGDIRTMYDSGQGDWYNKRDGASRASSRHSTKAEAEPRGQQIARNSKVEWFGHKKDGQIGERNSYGNDPHPPKG